MSREEAIVFRILTTTMMTSRTHHWFAIIPSLIIGASQAFSWGATAHKIINKNSVIHLPVFMSQLVSQQTYLMNHASDADTRKSADPTEAPKHFVDLESYPDYAHLTGNIDSLTSLYGWNTVSDIGILPWAIVWSEDSLTQQIHRGDWTKAYETAADIGHYIGDGHQPLHCTVNYDGAQSGNNGIHSRYETGMINAYQGEIVVSQDSVHYVSDVFQEGFAAILLAHGYVDSILQADTYAKATSGWNGSQQPPSTYYAALWDKTGGFTKQLIQHATVSVASLWYTAWLNAGVGATDAPSTRPAVADRFALWQNYPNPFNPKTVISGQWPGDSEVRLEVFDILGRKVATLADGQYPAGKYTFAFDGTNLASGVYVYRLTAGSYSAVRKMFLIR